MKNFYAPAERLGKRFCADRHDHEFLEINVVIGMGATVEDVHHRRRQGVCACAAEVAVQRQCKAIRRGPRGSHRDGKNRIRAQSSLIFGAIELNHFLVQRALVGGVEVRQGVGYLAVYIFHGLEHTFADVNTAVAVAQLNRFVLTGRSAAGDDGPALRSILKPDFCLHRRIAARIQHLPAAYFCNIAHVFMIFLVWNIFSVVINHNRSRTSRVKR